MPMDVSDKDAVVQLWKDVGEKLGKVDVLINNAGRIGTNSKLGEGHVGDWLEVLARPPLESCQERAADMRDTSSKSTSLART